MRKGERERKGEKHRSETIHTINLNNLYRGQASLNILFSRISLISNWEEFAPFVAEYDRNKIAPVAVLLYWSG